MTQTEVLAAMEYVPRHLFVPDAQRANAYLDQPMPLSQGRTIYQPYVVALMTQLLAHQEGGDGAGGGDRLGVPGAAVLSRVAREVYSIEIDAVAASQASKRLSVLGYHNITVRIGDGYQGWPGAGTVRRHPPGGGAAQHPQAAARPAQGGRKMVAPVGGFFQDLQVITKTAKGLEKRAVIPVRLAPMTGQVQDGKQR